MNPTDDIPMVTFARCASRGNLFYFRSKIPLDPDSLAKEVIVTFTQHPQISKIFDRNNCIVEINLDHQDNEF